MLTLSSLVRDRRKELDMTQEQLADCVGVDRSAIGHIESGHVKQPAREVLLNLAHCLELPPATIALAVYGITRTEKGGRISAEEMQELRSAIRAAVIAGSGGQDMLGPRMLEGIIDQVMLVEYGIMPGDPPLG